MPLHPPERRPCPVRKPPGHRSECRCAKFTPVGPDVFAVRHRGGGRTDPRGTNAVGRRFPRGGRPTGPERRRKCEEAGRRSAEPPIRTGRPNAVASGCRKETAASPCGARPGGASSEARHREGTGVPDSCGPGSRRVSRRGGAIKVSARPSLRRTAGRSFLRGEAPRKDGRT